MAKYLISFTSAAMAVPEGELEAAEGAVDRILSLGVPLRV